MRVINVLRNLILAAALTFYSVSFAQTPPGSPTETAQTAAEKAAAAAAKSAADAAGAASAAAKSAADAAGAAAKSTAGEAAATGGVAGAAKKVESLWEKPSPWLLYLVPIIAFLGALFAILWVRRALNKTTWSLSDALSEEVLLPAYKETTAASGVMTREPIYDKDGKPVLVPELKASSSRVIALMGLIAILLMFIGFGVFALFSFGSVGSPPKSMEEVVKFLVAGLTLFAPYLVNKFASLFQGLSGGK